MELTHTPEVGFIVACLSSELSGKQEPLIPPANVDWEKVANLVEEHRLAGHFYIFGKKRPGLFPDDLQARFKNVRYGFLIYGDNARLQVSSVLAALTSAGIPVIVMKGWALIPTFYKGDHSQRFCEDIDILIEPDQVDTAELILQKLGYYGIDEVTPGYSRCFANARAYMLISDNHTGFRRFAIGLHWGLTHYPFFDRERIKIGDIFARAKPLWVADVQVLEMSLEDQLVYTCAHLSLHHRNEETLLNYYEIAAILEKGESAMDWEEVITRANEWGYLVQLQYSLKCTHDFWPSALPINVLQKVTSQKTSRTERMIDRLVKMTKGNRFRSALIGALAIPGIHNKFRAALHQILPEKSYMQSRYHVAPGENLLPYYCRRFLGAIRGMNTRRSAAK